MESRLKLLAKALETLRHELTSAGFNNEETRRVIVAKATPGILSGILNNKLTREDIYISRLPVDYHD
jgi:hypothetical protein